MFSQDKLSLITNIFTYTNIIIANNKTNNGIIPKAGNIEDNELVELEGNGNKSGKKSQSVLPGPKQI